MVTLCRTQHRAKTHLWRRLLNKMSEEWLVRSGLGRCHWKFPLFFRMAHFMSTVAGSGSVGGGYPFFMRKLR
jgi:hypothetical protein